MSILQEQVSFKHHVVNTVADSDGRLRILKRSYGILRMLYPYPYHIPPLYGILRMLYPYPYHIPPLYGILRMLYISNRKLRALKKPDGKKRTLFKYLFKIFR